MEITDEPTLQSQADDRTETEPDSAIEDVDLNDGVDRSDDVDLRSYITEDSRIIPDIVSGIHSMDREVRLAATVKVRRLLQKLPPEEAAEPVINSGLLETVVGLLSSDDLEFRAEAAWILTNVASGTSEQAGAVVEAGAIPKLVALFPCDSTDAMDNALWALGNIAGDSERLRDLAVQEGGVKPVLDILDAPEKYTPKLLDTASWALTCFLTPRRDADLGYGVTRHMIPVLIKLINNTTDENSEPLVHAVQALNYISSNETAAEAVLATGIAPRLIEFCTAKNYGLQFHALRCIGQFTAGTEASTEAAIQAGLPAVLRTCIPSAHVDIRTSACWVASNIAAGSLSQAQSLFDNDLIPLILHVISNQEEEIKPRHEASWILSTLVGKGKEGNDILVRLVQANCMEAFVSGLSSPDHRTLLMLIEGIENVVDKQWTGREDALGRFRIAGGVGRLVALRDGPDTRGTLRTNSTIISQPHQLKLQRNSAKYHRYIMENADTSSPYGQHEDKVGTEPDSHTELKSFITDDLHVVPEIVSGIHSTDREVRLAATVKVRILLLQWPEAGAQPVFNSGLLETFNGMLSSDDLELCAEAAWALTNVVSGASEQAGAVVEAGAIPKLIALFLCNHIDAMDDALWALGSIGGDSQQLRDLVVQAGGLKPILDTLDTPENYTRQTVDTASWALSCCINPGMEEDLGYEVTRHIILVLIKFIKNTIDETLGSLTKVLKPLDYISSDVAAVEAILATGIAPRLVELCSAKQNEQRYHALRCVGQFTAGTDAATEAAVQAGLPTALRFCIPSEHVGTRISACWAASNIAAGSLSQAQSLFDNDLIPLIFRVLSIKDEEMKPRNEASWVLSILTGKGQEHNDFLVRLVQANCMEALAAGLSTSSSSTLSNLIEGLENVVDTQWSGREDALERFKVAGGVARLVTLRDQPRTRATLAGRRALGLLRSHFPEFAKCPRV
ncbi:Importin alpha subunit (Karyopherin alpha subunit) (Serine-rich RNA polymerase I suppressor protein) [Tulasnella sp. UAMH 9824]|nr:Importin alpha subunit (Karyopherin alpha subunit) (Serine-rich RNA polymerase I suppressor protein) [Tulasnella sp. UAMH 9824]